jgi:hypothetical protein
MDLMMSSVIVKNMVDLNILKVDEGHNLPHVTIMDRGGLYETTSFTQKENIQLWKHYGLCRDLVNKKTLEFYLSRALELLEIHMLSINFYLSKARRMPCIFNYKNLHLIKLKKLAV